MAHGRYPVSPCHLARNQPTISSIDALNASTGRCLTPTIGIYASRPHLRCTVAASEISIAPADRGARSPAGFLHWRLSNAGPATLLCVDSSCDGAGIRNPSHKRTWPLDHALERGRVEWPGNLAPTVLAHHLVSSR